MSLKSKVERIEKRIHSKIKGRTWTIVGYADPKDSTGQARIEKKIQEIKLGKVKHDLDGLFYMPEDQFRIISIQYKPVKESPGSKAAGPGLTVESSLRKDKSIEDKIKELEQRKAELEKRL